MQPLTEKLIDAILSKVVSQKLPYKIMVSATIVQKLGAGVHNAASAFWDTTQDGLLMLKWENEAMFVLVNAFFTAV